MKKVYFIFSLLFFFIVFFYTYQPLGENFYIISDIIPISLSFLAFILGFYAYKFYGSDSFQGKAFLSLSVGIFFWFLGETTWGIYEIFLGIKSPVASLADAFWLFGYPFFFLGFYYIWKTAKAKIKKIKLVSLVFLSFLILIFLFYLIKENLINPEISLSEKISTESYVIGDMLLLISIIFVTANLFETKTFRAYSLIILGIISMSIADVYYMKFLEVYATGNLIDIWWDLSYILIALGFFSHRESMKNLLKKK